MPAHGVKLRGNFSYITFGCAWYPAPASTKTPVGWSLTIARSLWALVVPASDGHPAPLDALIEDLGYGRHTSLSALPNLQ